MDTNVLVAALRSRVGASHELRLLLPEAKWGNLAEFDRIMAQVPDVSPADDDKLPEDYRPAH